MNPDQTSTSDDEFVALARLLKRHKRERTRDDRARKITKALEEMPTREAKYRKEVADKKPTRNVTNRHKRLIKLYEAEMRRVDTTGKLSNPNLDKNKSDAKARAMGKKKAD